MELLAPATNAFVPDIQCKPPSHNGKARAVDQPGEDEEDEDSDATPVKSSAKKPKGSIKGKKLFQEGQVTQTVVSDDGRVSQFMDADEADARVQVQQQLAAGVKLGT